MYKAHVIAKDAINEILSASSKGENWLAYNNEPFYLDKYDMYFFTNSDEAKEFAANNISDHDSFKVIYFESSADVFRQISHGDTPSAYTFTGGWRLEAEQEFSNNLKHTVMNDNNLEFLKEQLKNMGFGDKLNK